MSENKKIDFRTKSVPIISARLMELNKREVPKDPKSVVAHELEIQFYKDYLTCTTSK